MRYIDEFRDEKISKDIIERIKALSTKDITLMEFCGGHTVTILKYGIQELLPKNIRLISGPGCPVCVTSSKEIDKAISISLSNNTIFASFGDMARVNGSSGSLLSAKAEGGSLSIVYSPYDALLIAKKNRSKKVVFMGIGFETTIPATASVIIRAYKEGVENFSVLTTHKTTPAILKALLESGPDIDGFICPGHVSAITGTSHYYEAVRYNKCCVIAGFELTDILQSIYMLISQFERGVREVEIQYSRVVSHEGSKKGRDAINEVFEPCDSEWRGIGVIPESGLKIRDKYRYFDADRLFETSFMPAKDVDTNLLKLCICGEILKGFKTPKDCTLFSKICTPESPIGACMVSYEGTCASYFRFSQ